MSTDFSITNEMISQAEQAKACKEAIEWLRKASRTWKGLVEHCSDWAAWAMTNIPGFPINLEGLDSYSRAWVMAERQDCPINLEGLSSDDRAQVMVERKDCPINLEGLDSSDRAWVMISRPEAA